MSTSVLIRLDESSNRGNVILGGISVACSGMLWVYVANRVRGKSDPARTAVVWMQLLLPIQLLAMLQRASILFLAESAVKLDSGYNLANKPPQPTLTWGRGHWNSEERAKHNASVLNLAKISGVVNLFSRLADIAILMAIFELANGFAYARRGTRTLYQSAMRSFSVGAAFTMAVAALIATGIYYTNVDSWVEELSKPRPRLFLNFGSYATAQVAADLIRWAVTLPSIGYALYIVCIWKDEKTLRPNSMWLFAASIIMFVRCALFIGFEGTLGPDRTPEDMYPDDYSVGTSTFRHSPNWAETKYTASVLSWVFFNIVTMILAYIGGKRRNGLWTTRQPFHVDYSPIPDPVFGCLDGQANMPMDRLSSSDYGKSHRTERVEG